MNLEEYRQWQDDVMENSRMAQTIIHDKVVLKELMTSHLKEFFDFDDIEYTPDFNKIILKWNYTNDPIIYDPLKLKDLNMGFIITHGYSSELGSGIRIELYPFGLSKDVINNDNRIPKD